MVITLPSVNKVWGVSRDVDVMGEYFASQPCSRENNNSSRTGCYAYSNDAGGATEKQLGLLFLSARNILSRISHGCHGRVERWAVLLKTHICNA